MNSTNTNGSELNSDTENNISLVVTSDEDIHDDTIASVKKETMPSPKQVSLIKTHKSPRKDPASDIEDDIKEIFGKKISNPVRKNSRSTTLSNTSKRSSLNKSPVHAVKTPKQQSLSPASVKGSPKAKSPVYDKEKPSTSKRVYSELIKNPDESESEEDFLGFDNGNSTLTDKKINEDASAIESETALKKVKHNDEDKKVVQKSEDEDTDDQEGNLQIAESADEENSTEPNDLAAIKKIKSPPKITSPKVTSPKITSPKMESPKRTESPKRIPTPKIQSPKPESPKLQSHKIQPSKVLSPAVPVIKDNPIKNEAPTPNTPVSSLTTTSSSSTKLRPCEDPVYKKPFDFGWKREVVLRALPNSKDKGEIYYITPNGKKLRTRNEIQSHLTPGLSLENFTFSKDPLNANPEHETVRMAKPMGKHSTPIAEVTPRRSTSLGKRMSKPKVPKGASPPPEGWTPGKAAAGSYNVTPARSRAAATVSVNTSEVAVAHKAVSVVPSKKNEICTIQCPLAMGIIPQLKCLKCLCSYHPECVGLSNPQGKLQKNYECSSCKNQSQQDSQNSQHHQEKEQPLNKNSLNNSSDINNKLTKGQSQGLTKDSKLNLKQSHFSATPISTNNNNNNSNNNSNNTNVTAQSNNKVVANLNSQQKNKILNDENIEKSSTVPQTIAVINGRKYLLIHKPTDSNEKIDSSTLNEGSRKRSAIESTNNTTQKIIKVDTFATNFFGNVSTGYDILLNIFQYLKVQELLRAACTCRVWNVVANHRLLWKTVRMKNSQVNDWVGLAASLRRNETKHLDLRKMICQKDSSEEQMWSNFTQHIKSVVTLKQIDLGKCPSDVVQNLFDSAPQLVILNALTIKSDSLNLDNIYKMQNLQELRLKTSDGCNFESELNGFEYLTQLRHLSLTSINDLGKKNCDVFGNLINLESLELGECSHFSKTFAENVLAKLQKLERLRLEKSTEPQVTSKILQVVSELPKLNQLELINFDIKDGFEENIILCKNVKRLLLIPTYISQSATTNHIILSSMRKLANTLESFIWVVTMELLRVTALYVDQVGPRIKKQIDESIPVLKPVPGLQNKTEKDPNQSTPDTQQVDILPLTKIKEILTEAMPNGKHKILKLTYPSTWRQNFIE